MDVHCNAEASNHATIAARIKGDLSKKRKGMPKTRTGCRTCRRRHIKCDERKPVCLRCEKLGVQCQGLGYSGSGSVRARAGPVWLQKSENRLSRSLVGGLAFNELDMRYFQLFQAHSTTDLSGYFQSDFWGRLILQQGQCEPSIKDAIIAIGALYKSIEVARKSPPSLDAEPNQLVHFKSAIQHYQKAVRSQRRSLEVGDLQWRTSLISCLLFVCFEALQGDHYSVWQQIFCGLHLLLGHGRPLNSSQPACADRMDEELSQIFSRLEIHIRIYDDVRPEQYILPNLSMKLHHTGIRDSLSKLQSEKRLHPFIESVEEARYTWDILFPKVLDVRHRTEPYRFVSKKDVPPEVFMEVEKQIDDLLLWKAAFQPLFQKTWNNTNDRNRPGVSVLYINYMFGYLKIATCFELSEMVYDSFLWEFQETVRVSRYLLESEFLPPHQKPTFLLDSVVLNPLFFAALKCRDRVLRREANALLKSSDRREGMWDLKMLSCIIDWMISNEEEGLEPDAPIRECNRFRMLNLKCSIHQRTGWAKCGRHIDGGEDYVDVREVTFNY